MTLKIRSLVCVLICLLKTHGQDKQAYQLEEYTVVSTGTRTERLVTESPIKTSLLGSDLMQSASVTELGQAIELLNGARTEANCQDCGTAEIQLLGLPGNYNQILVDGLPIFTGIASVYGIDQVPTIFVEQIEVVKGGGSSLYGPNAVAGLINLNPEEPHVSGGELEFNILSIDGEPAYQTQLASYFVSDDNKVKTAVYGLFHDQSEYDANEDEFSEIVKRTNRCIGSYLWWEPTENSRLRFNSQYIGEDRRGGDRLNFPVEFAQVAEYLETEYHWATLRWDQELTEELNCTFSLAVVNLSRSSYYGGTGSQIIDPSVDFMNYKERTVNGGSNSKAVAFFGDPKDGTGGGAYNAFGRLDSRSYYVETSIQYRAGQIGTTGLHEFRLWISSRKRNR